VRWPGQRPDVLATRLIDRFERSGDLIALSAGIDLLRQAVSAAPTDRDRAEHARNLVVALAGRYDRTRDVADLNEAVELGQAPFTVDHHEDSEVLALRLAAARAQRLRYEQLGDSVDLDESLSLMRKAVAVAVDRQQIFAATSELSWALYNQYQRTDYLPDLREAISMCERAIASTGRRSRHRLTQWMNLCYFLTISSESGSLTDLDRAIVVGDRVVARLSKRDRLRPGALYSLASAYRHRYERRGLAADVDRAIELTLEAVARVASDHPNQARFHIGAAMAFQQRHVETGQAEDLRLALDHARAATIAPHASPAIRVICGLGWVEIAAKAGDHAEAVRAFEHVVPVLPQLASPALARTDQERRLTRGLGAAGIAAGCALAIGRPETAVTLLEAGRGVLLSRALEVRTDVRDLSAAHPELAERVVGLRRELAATSARDVRRVVVDEFEATLRQIRGRDGFADFGRSLSPEKLRAQAAAGPIVFVNYGLYRSDAIILTTSGFQPVALPAVTRSSVVQHMGSLFDNVQPGRLTDRRRQEGVFAVLEWMWDAIAAPILDSLEPAASQQAPRRLWWVPTGSLVFLPLHAAGYHRSPDGATTVMDQVISSYTPTVRALAEARRRTAANSPPNPLVVAMPSTPGAEPLPTARAEGDLIRALFPAARLLVGAEASAAAVAAELPGRSWAHFACHTVQNSANPSDGGLLLHDTRRPALTISDISALELETAELAYLSSCAGAEPAMALWDESIHLASAFQLAGFQQVIANLWPLDDQIALGLARDIYQYLSMATTTETAQVPAASAVRQATLRTRDAYPNFPALWAGHIHVGC
jgi:tetratricopeptide (TPR) repeat protein